VWDPSDTFIKLGNAFEQTTEFDDRKRAYLALSAEWQRLTPGFFLWKNLINWAHKSSIQWVPIGANDMRMFGPYLKV
jgi:peptide/nickel transport system substrate-binding protein